MTGPLVMLRNQGRGVGTALSTVVRLRRDLYPYWRSLLVALFCAIGYTGMRLLEPWPLKFIFDNVLTGAPLSTPFPWVDEQIGGDRMRVLATATGAILFFAVLRGFFYYYQNVLTSRVGQQVVMTFRRRLFAHMQRLSLRFHNQSSTGDLLTRLTSDINNLRELLTTSMLSLVSETVIIIGFVTVMFVMNWRLALLTLITMPVIFGLVTVYSGRIRKAASKQRRREGELASRLHESLSGIHIVQMFTRERDEEERLRDLNRRSLRSGLKTARLEARLNQGVEVSIAAGMALTLWFGATEVIAGRLSPGELIVFVTYMQSFNRPMRRISRIAERASKASTCVDRITEVLDQEPDIRNGRTVAPVFRGGIRFDHVSFAHAGGNQVLHDVDLSIAPGQTVALVGPSGAGKSTLISLVPRLYDPTEGAVLIDGQDVRSFTLKSLRDQISVVPQDGMLFAGTIRENIAYGKPEATDEEIEAAARAANIHDFIVTLDSGYDTPVSERGVSLSGGQRQRLAIARAMVRDAPIILLDEPTTGLDPESEGLVMEALDRLLTGRTAIVIAHRLSTVQSADVILIVEDGRIVEKGRHADLLAINGRYRVLYDRQFEAWEAGRDASTISAQEVPA